MLSVIEMICVKFGLKNNITLRIILNFVFPKSLINCILCKAVYKPCPLKIRLSKYVQLSSRV